MCVNPFVVDTAQRSVTFEEVNYIVGVSGKGGRGKHNTRARHNGKN